jgi:hypothetical protein
VTPWHLTKCHLGSGFLWPRRTDFIPNQTTSSAVLLVAPFIKNASGALLAGTRVVRLEKGQNGSVEPARGTTAFSCDTRFGEGHASSTFSERDMSLMWVSRADRGTTEANRRRWNRIPIRCWLRLSYQSPSGDHRVVRGRALDVSSSGPLIQALRPIRIGSRVRIVRGDGWLVGTTYVRHCSRRGWGFKIGLEFATPFAERF